MRARKIRTVCTAALAGCLACSTLDVPAPRPHSVEPARGWAGDRTAIVIRGEGFVARTTQPMSGGAVEVETGHRAWLGNAELEDVVRVDSGTLLATVPAGLPSGLKPLTVENAFGVRGVLEGAFEVVATPGAVLSATLAPVAAFLSVGQEFTLRATIENRGNAPALGVTAAVTVSSGGGQANIGAPTPASAASLAPGASMEFSWSCVATAAGELTLAVAVVATDELSGRAVEGSAGTSVVILLAAGLAATVAASRATADTGQAVTVTFTVTNGGTATAEISEVIPSVVPALGASCTPPVPTPPLALGSEEFKAFTWTCAATDTGSFALSGTVRGADANSGAPLSATPASPAQVVVQTPAALDASISLPPGSTTASVGQPLDLTLNVANAGGADAEVTTVTPTVTPADAAACGTPTPAPPQIVVGGGSAPFTWTCTPAVQGIVTFGASIAGVDRNTGAPLAAVPAGATTTVDFPAALTAVVQASPAVASVGQPVSVTFTVANGGNAAAIVSSVEVTSAGTAAATCGQVTPAPPQSIAAGEALAFASTCTPSTAGSLFVTGTVTGTDAVSEAVLSATPTTAAAVAVQEPTALAATAFTATRTTASVGQEIGLALTLSNAGGATAELSAILPTVEPASSAACTAPDPGPPVSLPGGTSVTFTWSCTGTVEGGAALGAAITAIDINTGSAAEALVSSIPVLFEATAALSATSFSATPATPTVGEPILVTLVLSSTGGAAANVSTVTPSASPASSIACTAAAPALPQVLPAGESLALSWSCTASAARSYTLRASVAAFDANSGVELTVSTPTLSVTVQPAG